jgi:hypothetical protein
MLGDSDGRPSLLVTVKDDFDPANFSFRVINGGWDGTYTNGDIRVIRGNDDDDTPVGAGIKILTEEQDRLRGDSVWDYQTVFNSFDNPKYVGPVWEPVYFADMDDDIAF